jgi:hypothetical protein
MIVLLRHQVEIGARDRLEFCIERLIPGESRHAFGQPGSFDFHLRSNWCKDAVEVEQSPCRRAAGGQGLTIGIPSV